MARELLIMRHAKSDWSNASKTDFDRPLNKRGREAAPKIGRWLAQQALTPDYVISSPALRAKQTVQQVCGEIGFELDQITWEPRIYEASLTTLLTVLSKCLPASKRVLLVGHNPGLDRLLLQLSADIPNTPDGKFMVTAAIAHLIMPDDWGDLVQGSGELQQLQRPRELTTD